MNRIAALASVAALFLVGVLVGGLGTYLFFVNQPHRPAPGGPRGDHFLELLERELALTTDQMRRIEQILEQSHAEGDALRREMLPRLRGAMTDTRDRIREVLTPEQQATFEKLRLQHWRRVERMFLGRGRRPGRPRDRLRPLPPREDK